MTKDDEILALAAEAQQVPGKRLHVGGRHKVDGTIPSSSPGASSDLN